MEPDVAEESAEESPIWGEQSTSDTDEPEPDESPDEEPEDTAESSSSEEPDVAEVDLGEDDFGGDDLFDDVEDADDDGDGGDPLDELEQTVGAVEGAVNSGAARAAVAGLEDEEELQEEFEDIFGAFRLGHFADQFADEYLFVDGEDIDPAWGLFGSMLCCCAVVLWMRPDGDEQIERLQSAVSGISGGN